MVERIGVFTPDQARELWHDYLDRKAKSAARNSRTPLDTSPHRVLVKNSSGEEVPSFGCMEIRGVEVFGNRTCLTVDKPQELLGEYLINSEYPIAAGAAGWGYRFGVVLFLGDEPDEPGWTYRPQTGSWELEPGPGPFVAWGRHDFSDRALIGRIAEWPDVPVVLEETVDASTTPLGVQDTYTASVLRRNSDGELDDTGINIEVVNRYEHIDLPLYTLAVARRIAGEWRLISADCSPLTNWPP